MTDVLKMAIDLRSKLQSEVTELDRFIDMANTLTRDAALDHADAPASTTPTPPAGDREAPARSASEPKGDEATEAKKDPRPGFLRRSAAG